jgi:hypothetical protein
MTHHGDDELARRRRHDIDARYRRFCRAICGEDSDAYSDDQLRSLFCVLRPKDPANIVIATCRYHGLPEWRHADPAHDSDIMARARQDADEQGYDGDINDHAALIEWHSSMHCCEDLSDFAQPWEPEDQKEYDLMMSEIAAALGHSVHPDHRHPRDLWAAVVSINCKAAAGETKSED